MGLSIKSRTVAGLLSMVGGCLLVFWLIVLMNDSAPPPKPTEQVTSITAEVQREKQQPKKKASEQPRPRPRNANNSPKAPPPSLSQSISGLSFGLPELSGSGLEDAERSVLGEDASAAGMVMTEDTVDEPPRPLAMGSPSYPPRARAKGLTGSVTLSILVGIDGSVEQVKVLQADPPGEFENAAMEAARSWRFSPATYKGQPVRIWARKVVSFKLT
ncbi:MAG: energy transducer TonB [Myxococcota bacterium]|jgi:protein TonB|nr:energy transducer TonB [Myxococcota bacterium]